MAVVRRSPRAEADPDEILTALDDKNPDVARRVAHRTFL
jgi:plasmid stabilization system protein ParE